MIHTAQTTLTALFGGLMAHMEQWDGWAASIAAALFGYRRGVLWMPLLVAVIINPTPYALVADVFHGRHVGIHAAASFTLDQIVVAYAGYAIGRIFARFR